MKKKIFIAGHNGMVGSSLIRLFKKKKNIKLITINRSKLDLRDQKKTELFVKKIKPNIIINAAAKVGGIKHNSDYPAEFFYDNILISTNLIHSAYKNKVRKFINLGSACIYPKICKQPIKEEYLLTGKLEKTNEAYAIAKISALKMCEFYNTQYKTNFISLQPTNLYGENDNFDLKSSHVLPALIRKFHEAKVQNKKYVEIWGTGRARREFLYVDDLADATHFLINKKIKNKIINVGSGKEVTIRKLAEIIRKIVGFNGSIIFNHSMPDGTPRRIVDNTILKKNGWKSKIDLISGIKKTYKFYIKNYDIKKIKK